uniref:Uncharacterized protein n=1 Tax=viral metagenome TaxID=1070528 RepID=A0A6M3JK75_9ZZZZ
MCKQCNDTGRLPFIRPDGSISKTSFIYCSCYNEEPEHYQAITPDMFDYAQSDTFWEHTYRYCGIPDPMAVTPTSEVVREVRIEVQPANLQHVSGELRYLHQKMTELRAEKKKGQVYEPF